MKFVRNKLTLEKGKHTGKLPNIALSLQTQSSISISETKEEDHIDIRGTLHFKCGGITSVSRNSKYTAYDNTKSRKDVKI
jgi:hypothetical protein